MSSVAPSRPQETVPIKEAAGRLGVHENTIRNWIDRQIVQAYRLPSGRRKLPAEEVARLEREMFGVPTSYRELPLEEPVPTYPGTVEAPNGRLP